MRYIQNGLERKRVMLEILLANKPPLPPPDIWERLTDNSFSVGTLLGVVGVKGKVYFDEGNLFNVYDIATGLLSTILKKRQPGTLAYSYGSLLVDPGGTVLYSTGSVPFPYQPDSLGRLRPYSIGTDAWGSAIGGVGSTDAKYFGYNVVAGIVGSLLIVVGGTFQGGTQNLVTFLTNIGTGITSNRAGTPWGAGKAPVCGATVYGYFYVLSGTNSQFLRTSDGINWTSLSTPPKPSGACKCVADANKIYFYGGNFARTIYVYNTTTNSWSTLQPGGPGNVSGLAVWEGKLYVFYGTQIWTAELNP